MSTILNWVVTNLGWLFIISATCFVLFAFWLAFSRYGRIPLGRMARNRSSTPSAGSR